MSIIDKFYWQISNICDGNSRSRRCTVFVLSFCNNATFDNCQSTTHWCMSTIDCRIHALYYRNKITSQGCFFCFIGIKGRFLGVRIDQRHLLSGGNNGRTHYVDGGTWTRSCKHERRRLFSHVNICRILYNYARFCQLSSVSYRRTSLSTKGYICSVYLVIKLIVVSWSFTNSLPYGIMKTKLSNASIVCRNRCKKHLNSMPITEWSRIYFQLRCVCTVC
jgi:hypothetical protein